MVLLGFRIIPRFVDYRPVPHHYPFEQQTSNSLRCDSPTSWCGSRTRGCGPHFTNSWHFLLFSRGRRFRSRTPPVWYLSGFDGRRRSTARQRHAFQRQAPELRWFLPCLPTDRALRADALAQRCGNRHRRVIKIRGAHRAAGSAAMY